MLTRIPMRVTPQNSGPLWGTQVGGVTHTMDDLNFIENFQIVQPKQHNLWTFFCLMRITAVFPSSTTHFQPIKLKVRYSEFIHLTNSASCNSQSQAWRRGLHQVDFFFYFIFVRVESRRLTVWCKTFVNPT